MPSQTCSKESPAQVLNLLWMKGNWHQHDQRDHSLDCFDSNTVIEKQSERN